MENFFKNIFLINLGHIKNNNEGRECFISIFPINRVYLKKKIFKDVITNQKL